MKLERRHVGAAAAALVSALACACASAPHASPASAPMTARSSAALTASTTELTAAERDLDLGAPAPRVGKEQRAAEGLEAEALDAKRPPKDSPRKSGSFGDWK